MLSELLFEIVNFVRSYALKYKKSFLSKHIEREEKEEEEQERH